MESSMEAYICETCGYEYDPGAGDPDNGVAAKTPWDEVPDEWVCPVCDAGKDAFEVA
jgi:rubredoxin